MPAPKKFVVLSNRDLAIVNVSAGQTKVDFTNSDISELQTVTFDTTNPCVAVIDNEGTQWDLNDKRVWYTQAGTTIDLTDILYAKNLITTAAGIVTSNGIYIRDKDFDTASGYSWSLYIPATNVENPAERLFTKSEAPELEDEAYFSPNASGQYISVQSYTPAIAAPIPGTWYAVFTAATVQNTGNLGYNILYTIATD
jgi:hypothetical protein